MPHLVCPCAYAFKNFMRAAYDLKFFMRTFQLSDLGTVTINLAYLWTVLSKNLTDLWTVLSKNLTDLWTVLSKKTGIFVDSPVLSKNLADSWTDHRGQRIQLENLCSYAQHMNFLMRLSIRSLKKYAFPEFYMPCA